MSYILRLICAACICALVGSLCPKTKLLTGIFLILTVFSPVGTCSLPELDLDDIAAQASEAAAVGTAQAEREKEAIISASLEAYIFSKAACAGCDVTAEVQVRDGLPCAVTVTGDLTQEQREILSGIIASELGLGKEAQKWIDPHQSSGLGN